MAIRKAEPSDLYEIQRCARAAYEPYVPRIGKSPAPMVADFLSQIEAENVYVECTDQGVRGFVVFYPQAGHIHVENVAVYPENQGLGIGTRLLRFVEDAAARGGFHAIELYTNEKMTENFVFYRHLGYEEIGRWEEEGFNRVFYRKELPGN